MPKPGQPNDQATWVLRTVECSSTISRLAIAQGTFSSLSDIYLIVVPVGCMFKLQMPLQRNLGISGDFSWLALCEYTIIFCLLSSR